MHKRPFCFKMSEELIWGILRENNVELSKDTLNFYLKKALEDHKDRFSAITRAFVWSCIFRCI